MNKNGKALLCAFSILWLTLSMPAKAGMGYFLVGYGPYANQTAGTSTAIGLDAFAGAINPAKLTSVENRVDLGAVIFMPHRTIKRTGSNDPRVDPIDAFDSDDTYDFSSTSENELFFIPDGGLAMRINDRWSWGITVYGNGGLNTEYTDDSGEPGSNFNQEECGDEPSNFFFGCGRLGFDLSQVIVAPMLAWKLTSKHSIAIAPLLGYQRFKAYGLQAFESISQAPEALTNRGSDDAFGAGVRVGWYGEITPWLTAGAAYASKIYMQEFDKYEGLLAGSGDFDIPANYSVGVAITPWKRWTIGIDIQRIRFGEIRALGNGVLNSIQDPENSPLGSNDGSGFNWRNQTNYKIAASYVASPKLTLRTGYAYGKRVQKDDSVNSVSFNMFTPNPLHQASIGFTWTLSEKQELNFGYTRYVRGTYDGPSASAEFGVGGREKITPYVDQIMIGWSRRL